MESSWQARPGLCSCFLDPVPAWLQGPCSRGRALFLPGAVAQTEVTVAQGGPSNPSLALPTGKKVPGGGACAQGTQLSPD